MTRCSPNNLAPAAASCGFKIGWHSFRHTYRHMHRNLDDVPHEVQQTLMRPAHVETTLSYGGNLPVQKMRPANTRVIEMVRRVA